MSSLACSPTRVTRALCVRGVIVMLLLGGAYDASAQTNCTGANPIGGGPDTNIVNAFIITSVAGVGTCPEVATGAWLNVPGGSCVPGYGTLESGECWDQKTSGNALAGQYKIGCGPVSGFIQHGWKEPVGTNVWSYTSIYASNWTVTCPSDPPDSYCEYQWIPYPGLNDWQCQSPILVSTRRDQQYRLTSPADGVLFDLDGDGILEQISWTKQGDDLAWLAIDLNENGVIDSGHELVGDRMLPTAKHGFEVLYQMSQALDKTGQHLASVTEDDEVFDKLLLWTDRNHNGISERSEIEKFNHRFAAITLGYTIVNRVDEHHNIWKYEGYAQVRTAPGKNRAIRGRDINDRSITIYDVYLQKVK
jgi:hypothetical protein